MPQREIRYLDEIGVQELANQLAAGMNQKIYDSIISNLNSSADNKHSLGAAALFTLLGAANASDSSSINGKINNLSTSLNTLQTNVNNLVHLQIEVITGPITSVTNPSTSKLYLQRDDAADNTFVMYIYRENIEVAVLDSNNNPKYDSNDQLVTQIVNQWVPIGKTDIILQNYWSKDEVSDLRTALGMYNINFIANDDTIINKVNSAFAD